jgi:hypothetical protein
MTPASRSVSRLVVRLLPALGFAALGAGCVGYNSTVFVTKSNAGLDFDATPPTTEITISRKEGVIAPSFEGGQTPPVVASFKPHAGTGNSFENFFFGVDQTFAGGDAALAMTQLYDHPVAGSAATAAADYDSGITVTEPAARFRWQRIPEPSAVRPFLFATDTLLGLKIGWTGSGTVPDSVKAGFNRKELAWAPLSKTSKDPATGKVTLKSPSFLATIDHDVRAGRDRTESRAVQYFATGKAATNLALQPAVREAMLTRMDPSFRLRLGVTVLADALVSVDTLIDNLAASGSDPVAASYRARLDSLTGIDLPVAPLVTYSFDASAGLLTRRPWPGQPAANATWEFNDYTAYLAQLESNVAALRLTQDALAAGKAVNFRDASAAATSAAPLPAAVRAGLSDAQLQDSLRLEHLRQQLTTNRDVVAAYLYVVSQLAPR